MHKTEHSVVVQIYGLQAEVQGQAADEKLAGSMF